MSFDAREEFAVSITPQTASAIMWALVQQRKHTEKMISINVQLGDGRGARAGRGLLAEIDAALAEIGERWPVE